MSRYPAGGNLTALKKIIPNSPPDIRLIAVGETLRRLNGKCLCALVKENTSDFFRTLQLGVACASGTEKIVHGLRRCVVDPWLDNDFAVIKIDMKNAINQGSSPFQSSFQNFFPGQRGVTAPSLYCFTL